MIECTSRRPLPGKLEVFFLEAVVIVVEPFSNLLQNKKNESYAHMWIICG